MPGIRRQPCGGDVPVDAKEPGGDGYVSLRGRRLPGVVRRAAGPTAAQGKMIRWTSMRWEKAQEKASRKERTRKALLAKERAAKARTARAMSFAGTLASLATTRRTADKSGDRTKVGQKQVREVANTLMDGLGVVSKLKDGGQRQIGRVQDSG